MSNFFVETENIERIKEENDEYLELCAAREGNDKFVGREMQTFNNKLKDKQTRYHVTLLCNTYYVIYDS